MKTTRKALFSYDLAYLAFATFVLWSAPCTGFVPSSPLSPGFKTTVGHNDDGIHCFSSISTITNRETVLFMDKKHNDSQEEEEEATRITSNNFFTSRVEDPSLLAVDVFAIAIASQLMGLLDILNDPEFVKNGGWFQPIPAVPSTLNVLVERFSILTLSWLSAALLARKGSAYDRDAVATDEAAIKKSFRILLDFCVLRFLTGILYSQVVVGSDPDVLSLLRDTYFVGLAVTGFRFLYGQYFRF